MADQTTYNGDEVLGTVAVPLNITRQLCDDTVVTAIEGGTGYWAYVIEYEHDEVDGDWRNFRARIHAMEADDDPKLDQDYTIDAAAIADGIQKWLADPEVAAAGSPKEGTPRAYLMRALADNDAGDIDADVADVIVQYHCFGEVVFG